MTLEAVETVELGTEETLELDPELTHTLLEMWMSVLENIESEAMAPLRPADAMSLLQRWPILKMKDLVPYQSLYYSHLLEMRDIIAAQIDDKKEVYEHVEDDATYNRQRYVDIAMGWQLAIEDWEEEWTSEDEDAAIRLAALADVTNFTLSGMGLIAHLDQIGVSVTSEEMVEAKKKLQAKEK